MITFTQLGKFGRLGNMLFEISTTIALALRNNDKYVFPPWQYEKDFNLHNCFSNTIKSTKTYTEASFSYTKIPYTNTTNDILDLVGYWQSEKYFDDCQDVIQSLLTPKIGYGIKYNHTSLHCRRGDYVKQPQNYVPLEMDYYKKAIDAIGSKYYIVVSDDVGWCKNNFIGEQFIFSEGKSPIEDLALQIACEHNIICNSSFSWWGGWLNKNPSKIVVAPEKWFGPGLAHNTKDLIPMGWVKI